MCHTWMDALLNSDAVISADCKLSDMLPHLHIHGIFIKKKGAEVVSMQV